MNCGMTRLPCSGCDVPMLTSEVSQEPKCQDCRRNARMITCWLCRGEFDPMARGTVGKLPTCLDCRLFYRHTSRGTWVALLASK